MRYPETKLHKTSDKCVHEIGSMDSVHISSTHVVCGRKEQNRIAICIRFIFSNDVGHSACVLHSDVRSEWYQNPEGMGTNCGA
jgi:hypothetical protein